MIVELQPLSNIYQKRCIEIFSQVAERYPMRATGEKYETYRKLLEIACTTMPNNFVLELCCGTAKYAHMIPNCALYVGVDICRNMLKRAEVNCGNYFKNYCLINSAVEDFQSQIQYNVIFSIGTLGEYVKFDDELFVKIMTMLHPKGRMFFTVVDKDKYEPKKEEIDYDWSDLYLTKDQLKDIMARCAYMVDNFYYSIMEHTDNKHNHLICKVQKN